MEGSERYGKERTLSSSWNGSSRDDRFHVYRVPLPASVASTRVVNDVRARHVNSANSMGYSTIRRASLSPSSLRGWTTLPTETPYNPKLRRVGICSTKSTSLANLRCANRQKDPGRG
jgi:hypothetical protein